LESKYMAMNNYSYLQETHDAGKHTTGFIEMIITAQHSEINRSITKQARKTSGTFVQLRRTPAVKRDSPTELNLTTDEDKECSLPPKQKWNKLHFDPGTDLATNCGLCNGVFGLNKDEIRPTTRKPIFACCVMKQNNEGRIKCNHALCALCFRSQMVANSDNGKTPRSRRAPMSRDVD